MSPEEKIKWCEEHGCTCEGNKDINHGLANNNPCCGCWPNHMKGCKNE